MRPEKQRSEPRLTDFKVLSFDCYGTLIDWETGIYGHLQPLLARAGVSLTRDQVLEAHARHEEALEAGAPGMLYPDLLARVHDGLAKEWGVHPIPRESKAYGRSLKEWPLFLDSAAVLQYFQKYYTLVMLSNVDNENVLVNQDRLQVDFFHVFTAQDIGSYKPNLRNFDYMIQAMEREGFRKSEILHTAESLFHDHIPANQVGLASAWIHRRAGKTGWGAVYPPERMPKYDFRFESLAQMAKAHQDELRQLV
ncbi:MAG: haloacid dehalogenase [Holophaga sp.]|jgi:2-haloalkanoic acid dehalogenase type II